jgi:hypothetical protein
MQTTLIDHIDVSDDHREGEGAGAPVDVTDVATQMTSKMMASGSSGAHDAMREATGTLGTIEPRGVSALAALVVYSDCGGIGRVTGAPSPLPLARQTSHNLP